MKQSEKRTKWQIIGDWLYYGFLSLCIGIFLVNLFVVRLAVVSGRSMMPTLEDRELLVVWQLGYEPEAGDIVVIDTSTEFFHREYIVKRVIALEGQTVTIDYDLNTVCVDGTVLEEPYIQYNEIDPMLSPDWQPLVQYTVPEGCVFVLGDNRNHSSDSRNSRYGMIPAEDLLGKVTKVLPFKLPER